MPTATTKRFHLQTLELSSFFLCPVSLPPYRPKPSPFASIPLGQSVSVNHTRSVDICPYARARLETGID
ncbi:hypothetical protein Forpi1262_v015788 [Fusarium oxysporum f. sp. raphani]|uniref:Uncharacterized protein n=1 Tax=Fusarium oxysporum f. sp. raphani TaxID=96318 RepID=A0A8J5TZU5_FUSOX|nr:hypothetical protein Forpi1262_v015788 [Fusarium oxysporum f. sp. raphani]KAK2475255.1 hypothetical protein H9L39_12848 [Fusarium oxysporum f. sp. albedinis]